MSLALLLDYGNRGFIVFVRKHSNVCRGLENMRGVGLKVQPNNINLAKHFKFPSWRRYFVINNIAFFIKPALSFYPPPLRRQEPSGVKLLSFFLPC